MLDVPGTNVCDKSVSCDAFCVCELVPAHGSGLFFVQAEDGIRYLVRSRGLGDVYKRQPEVYNA